MKTTMILLTAAGFLFGGCASQSWKQDDFPSRVMLDGVTPLAGGHCESSALYNVLNYQGYPYSEAQVVGIGQAMGFLYEMGDFPFLGGRSLTMKEDFFSSAGIIWHRGDNSVPDRAWSEVVRVLGRGNPVILHVDMRYLPYLWGGKYGPARSSFGWHIIALFGIDFEKGEAYVTDTAYGGLRVVSLKDLDKARSSSTKILPPDYQWYWMEKAPAEYSPDWDSMVRDALEGLVRNYEAEIPEETVPKTLGGLSGLEEFPRAIRSLDGEIKPYLLEPVLMNLHGWIEEYGTGGASFRVFTRDFLESAYGETGNSRLLPAIDLLDKSIVAWHDLSGEFKALGSEIKGIKDKMERQSRFEKAAEKAETLYTCEREFYEYLKEM